MNKQLNPRQIKTIQNFWNWFQDNEQAIYHACKLEIDKEEVFFHIQRNLNYISKRIVIYIYMQNNQPNKFCVLFSAHGYRKLFPKIIALGEKAPRLEYFTAHTFLKPLCAENKNQFSDKMIEMIKSILIKLEDYNTASKKIILTLYMPENISNEDKVYSKKYVKSLLRFTLGEIIFKKHIKEVHFKPLPRNTNGLLSLSELPEFIDYLAKINYSRKLKIFFE
ncbi:hypothetical protein M9Q43_13620 [Flavobacterium sp. HXWNR29]|uniref:hypothetical protein n=1 Tax=Flavobacterium odoriferum TaxID=2946604 RepID=UPI0021CB69E1|nr:hypothetical protein [Flavobacterium sp. HXWNR29]MCU4190197.1 hypothetical protein [Flavobacterium sp. HXWNR29]